MRVVDQQPDAERETAQAHDVQRQAAEPHHAERRQHGKRDREADDERLAQLPRNSSTTSMARPRPDERRVAHRVDRVADEVDWSAIDLVVDVVAGRSATPAAARRLPTASATATVLASGCLRTDMLDRRHAVQARPQPLLLVRVRDVGDLGERNARRRARAVSSTARTSSTVLELAGRLADDLEARRGDVADRHVLVLRADARQHVGDTSARTNAAAPGRGSRGSRGSGRPTRRPRRRPRSSAAAAAAQVRPSCADRPGRAWAS
jgi:hypothetical protein